MKVRHGKYTYCGYTITCCGYHQPDHCVWWEAVDSKTNEASFHGRTLREVTRLIDESFLQDKINELKKRIADLEEWLVNHCDCEERDLTCDDCRNMNCPMKERK